MSFIRGKGGLVAHLGTADAIEVERRIREGDRHAKLVYDGMLIESSCARALGGLAAAADGRVDQVILTGGLAHSRYVVEYLTRKLSFIAPVEVLSVGIPAPFGVLGQRRAGRVRAGGAGAFNHLPQCSTARSSLSKSSRIF